MNNLKSTFSIKDLENLTGIKAHTIRIWERRYNLLQPERTETNIRYYDLKSLQTLLNVSYLNDNGFKISKIAAIPKDKLGELVKNNAVGDSAKDHTLNLLKLSMLNFDQQMFQSTYTNLSKTKSFREIFNDILIPLLSEIGVLWQTDTITPAHEHFISNLIRQKIILNTEKVQSTTISNSNTTFVLFLPDNEIHELGLMYLNFEIISRGYNSILLGPSVPISSLISLTDNYDNITFVSYFTIKPEIDELPKYLKSFENQLLMKKDNTLWVLGKMAEHVKKEKVSTKIKVFNSIDNLIGEL
ncbi:MerR family transcriptional regulator [Subsaxibacter sp. CAU 1640]|uniref:MerR family transcriptional regulator n=1 Tax=Subsaxibacter sp. CAU 1640 TaxID=2933271 RepID=UPI002004BC86|nr:MerR family transcriptional regulator [Subsaxibacter sp. CAU 1640]MCK7589846.1 MerR family transcriptional regulator [Subsaxibacter sp. CAU 1640]